MVLDILLPVIILTGIAVLFGILIAVCSIKFQVKTDERIEEIEMLLSGANCGACGYAGCADFARALVEGKADLSSCNATSKDNKKKILGFLDGGEVGEETIVVCACVGGHSCKDKYDYQGYGDCASQELLSGGRKACYMGCIGMSRCVNLCPSHAIDIKKGVAIINQDKCTQCGVCILQCPKKIMKRIPATAKYYVACSSQEKGKDVRAVCKRGCLGCGLCGKNCPSGAITMRNNLPIIDYTKCTNCGLCASKCPAKCILECKPKKEIAEGAFVSK